MNKPQLSLAFAAILCSIVTVSCGKADEQITKAIPPAQATQPEVQFTCNKSFDSAKQEYYYTTFAWNENNKKPLVMWQTEDFSGSGFTPEKRCQKVSPRFQQAYNQGSLNFIANGTMNNQPVLCTTKEVTGEQPQCETLLITLQHRDDGKKALSQLSEVLLGQANGPVTHDESTTSNGTIHHHNQTAYVAVDINEFLAQEN
jgi:Circadian oscillating protein COP23